ncbi:MAG: DJ-1/PfpI family protein [Candidatus Sericytochromatia bacterium]
MVERPKVLAVFYPGCIEYEIMLAIELLRDGFAIESCSPAGGLHHSQSGLIYQTHFNFGQVKPEDYRAILIPGGDPEALLENQEIDRLLQAAVRQGATLAAICAGPLIPAKAGLLKGKRFTHGYGNMHREVLAPFWDGASYEDSPWVRDGGVLTARPEAHIDFAVELAVDLGVIAREQAEGYKNYYKGSASV